MGQQLKIDVCVGPVCLDSFQLGSDALDLSSIRTNSVRPAMALNPATVNCNAHRSVFSFPADLLLLVLKHVLVMIMIAHGCCCRQQAVGRCKAACWKLRNLA